MSERELAEMTDCSKINMEEGNLINSSTAWNLTAALVTMTDVPLEDLRCHKKREKINAFLPVTELTREEAEDLCHKFGQDVHIAGEFINKEDFDYFYEGLSFDSVREDQLYPGLGLHRNKMYVERCGYYDNGRLRTWLPYRKKHNLSN